MATYIAAMCKDCLIEQRPDRNTCCLDEGAYVLNFKACAKCGLRDFPASVGRAEEEMLASDDEDPEETNEVEFKHACKACGHVIAGHFYREVTGTRERRFFMECMLCGKGAQIKATVHSGYVSLDQQSPRIGVLIMLARSALHPCVCIHRPGAPTEDPDPSASQALRDEESKAASAAMFDAVSRQFGRPPRGGAASGTAAEDSDGEWGNEND